jgi:two-component system response regulator HydG
MPTTRQDRAQTSPPSFVLAGVSSQVQRLRRHIERIAPYYRCALLLGEPGTGKETAARYLHSLSPAADGPFIVCTAAGLAEDPAPVEAAHRGTLFVDDVGSLPLNLQDDLVRRIAQLDRRVRARIAETRLVTASHTDLRSLSAAGHFRQDLYGRLAVVELRIVPLRERLEDLEELSRIALADEPASLQPARTLSPEALTRLLEYTWPGNLRELRQVIAQAAEAAESAEGERIELQHLPPLSGLGSAVAATLASPAIERLDEVVRRHVVDVLSRCAGNKFRAAELLGISRSTLYRMLDV